MPRAFTTRYNGLARVLQTEAGICLPFTHQEMKDREVNVRSYPAIWDTGATNSVITKRIVDDLQLKPIGVTEMHHAGGVSTANTYLVHIILPDRVIIGRVRVSEANLTNASNVQGVQPQILIGMDIIGMGDFAVTNAEGKTTLSFRIPASDEIDFVPDAQEDNVMASGNRHTRRKFATLRRHGKI